MALYLSKTTYFYQLKENYNLELIVAALAISSDNIALSKVIAELWNTGRNRSSLTIRQVGNLILICKPERMLISQKYKFKYSK